MAKEIDIRLNSKYNGKDTDRAKKHLEGLAGVFNKMGEALGGADSYLGRFLANVAKGGIWGMAAEGVGFLIMKIKEWATASERAQKEMVKASKAAHDERMKHINEYAAATEKMAQTRNAINSQHLKMLNSEVEATKELAKATLELQKAEARRRGDTKAVAAIDAQLADVDANAAADRLMNEMDAARARHGSERESYQRAVFGRDSANNEVKALEARLDELITTIRDDARARVRGRVRGFVAGVGFQHAPATEEEKQAAAQRAIDEFKETEEYKVFTKGMDEARAKAKEFSEKMAEAKRNMAEAAAEEENLGKKADALLLRDRTRGVNAEAEEAAAAAKVAEETARKTAEAQKKAAQEVAAERERLDRELHQKRMAQLKEEISAAGERGASLRTVSASAQSEFDRAFAMYRDPAQAASAIGEEKDYQEDLARLHKDAARYGGKWRIDELSRLMAAGDQQGVTDTLNDWRKLKGFTPEVEAMVRASAAERTKTTAEDELRKIEHNTADLAAQMKELLAMKG